MQGSGMAGRATCGHGAATGLGVRDGQGEAQGCQVLVRGCVGQSSAERSSPVLRSPSQTWRITVLWNQGILDLKRTQRHGQSNPCPDRRQRAAH